MTDRVGQQFGNYQLVKLLGRGGSAEVYLGKHRYLNSYAALKVSKAMIHAGDEHKFRTEAQRLVDLRHPHIVHLLDFCIEDGIIMSFIVTLPKHIILRQLMALLSLIYLILHLTLHQPMTTSLTLLLILPTLI